MQDVATAAGVSLKTVSRVVNQEGYVAAETASRVERAIAATGFRRNELARTMKSGRFARDLGLLLGDLSNPFFAEIAAAVIRGARARGYSVVLASADENPAAEREAIEGLLGRRVGGLLIVPGAVDYSWLAREVDLWTPVVFIDRPGSGVEATEVLLANFEGAQMAVRHLIDQGFERIAVIVAPSRYSTAERLRGYRQTVRRAFGTVDERLVKKLAIGSIDEARAATTALLASDSPPDAIFTTTGFMTQGAMQGLGARTDVALVGFDDLPLAERLARPVTVVTSEPQELGRVAIEALFERIDGAVGGGRRVIHPRLVVRGSGEAAQARGARRRSTASAPLVPSTGS